MQTPNSTDSRKWWDKAVLLGAHGYVCAGEAALRQASTASRGDVVMDSLCASTRASWIRQSGRHAQASAFDGVASTLAFAAVEADGGPLAVAALGDALTGLAADNLGVGRFGTTRRLLDRVEAEVLSAIAPDAGFTCGERVALRWRWVDTELALYSGDRAAAAERSAAGVESARAVPSERHRIKTDLIAAAAAAVNGDSGTARTLASSSAQRCAAQGLLPLQWAALTMLSGLGAADADRGRRADVERTAIAMELRRRGMYL